MTFDTYLKRLARDLHKLEGTADGQGRRPARRKVLASMRLLRAAVDREYPAIIVKGKVVRLKTFEGRLARAENAGWRLVRDYAPFVAVGVCVRRIGGATRKNGFASQVGQQVFGWLAPAWAVAIIESGGGRAQIIAAKRSRNVRAAALAAEAL